MSRQGQEDVATDSDIPESADTLSNQRIFFTLELKVHRDRATFVTITTAFRQEDMRPYTYIYGVPRASVVIARSSLRP